MSRAVIDGPVWPHTHDTSPTAASSVLVASLHADGMLLFDDCSRAARNPLRVARNQSVAQSGRRRAVFFFPITIDGRRTLQPAVSPSSTC